MAKFNDLLDSWDGEFLDYWRDQLNVAYDEVFSSSFAMNIQICLELENLCQTISEEITSFNADNYYLLMQIPQDDSADTLNDEVSTDYDEVEITIDDLFGNEDK